MLLLLARSVDEWIAKQDGGVTIPLLIKIFAQIAGGLQYLHRLGIVHK